MTDMHRLGDSVDDAVAEILELYPQLAHALERDNGTADGERVTTSTDVHAPPVNLDVLAALRMLQDEAHATTHTAREHLAEPAEMMSLTDVIASAAILYRRLVGRQLHKPARVLAVDVLRWHYTVRAAIGLSKRPRPLRSADGPVHCPLHDAPLTVLQQAGDEGHLDAGARGEREAVTWQRGGGLFCPHCGGGWGPSEYAFLGRLVAEQQARLGRAG